MNITLRPWLVLFAALVVLPVLAQASISQLQATTAVDVEIIVAASVASVPVPMPPNTEVARSASAAGITMTASISGLPHGVLRGQKLYLESNSAMIASAKSQVVAVSTPQGSIEVEAEVSPNPNATLLYTNNSGVIINATQGQTVMVTCAYTVTVDTAITNWQLKDGLTQDFDGSVFPGKDLSSATYLASPAPAPSPFGVYDDDGDVWQALVSSGGAKTYCVDLSVKVPSAVPPGTYPSLAVYTLYYA